MAPLPEDLNFPIRTVEGKPDPDKGCPGRWAELLELGKRESFWVDSEKGRGNGRNMLDGEVEVVEMMGIERDELGVWGMKEEKFEDVDWINLVMKLLKLWGSVVGAIKTKQGNGHYKV